MKIQELGPLQEEWLSRLENNPELQTTGRLGIVKNGILKMCCLGLAEIMLSEKDDIKPKSNRIGIWSSEPITTWDHRMYGDWNPYKSKYTWTT